jgi:hypothetical protein
VEPQLAEVLPVELERLVEEHRPAGDRQAWVDLLAGVQPVEVVLLVVQLVVAQQASVGRLAGVRQLVAARLAWVDLPVEDLLLAVDQQALVVQPAVEPLLVVDRQVWPEQLVVVHQAGGPLVWAVQLAVALPAVEDRQVFVELQPAEELPAAVAQLVGALLALELLPVVGPQV